MTPPNWNSTCVFADDQESHKLVCQGNVSEHSVHRAARHHNWQQSNGAVQTWTRAAEADAIKQCRAAHWQGLAGVARPRQMELVTHVALSRMDPDLRQRVLRDQSDSSLLIQAARAWHRDLSARSPERAVWIGARTEIDSVAAASSRTPVHAVVAALGMWHLGALPAGFDGAVLRVVYRVDEAVLLYKPDWRHGFPNFYFASAAAHTEAGRTRSLTTGQLQCKEWLAKIDTLDAQAHLADAECLVPDTLHNHYDLSPLYWQTIAAEIQHAAKQTP